MNKGPYVCFCNLTIHLAISATRVLRFCAACPNRKMYLKIRGANDGLFRLLLGNDDVAAQSGFIIKIFRHIPNYS